MEAIQPIALDTRPTGSKQPFFSVVIPTFNRASLVREAIESVLRQTFRDFEVIIIDDGSTDATPQVVFEALSGKANFVYRRGPNRGVSAARNLGIQVARGEVIAFLDSDDLWRKEKLAEQFEQFQLGEHVRVVHSDEIWLRNGKWLNQHKHHKKGGGRIFEQCLPLCVISPSSVAIRRGVFDRVGFFDERLPACEDYDLWLRITARYSVHFIPRKLVIKRGGHQDQLSQSFWGMDRFRVYALKKIMREVRLTPHLRYKVQEELRRKCSILSNGAFRRKNFLSSFYYNVLPRTVGIRAAVWK